MPASLPAEASTWDDVECLMYADEPANFMLTGETATTLRYQFPSAAAMVEALRGDPDTRILPGRPPREGIGQEVRALDTRDGTMHLGGDDAAFSAWFRTAPLPEALASPFSLAHFQLAKFFASGGLLEGFDGQVLEPWKAALADAGYAFDRCMPYVFISGARDVGAFHHDVSHVVAWQIEGTKRFCGYHAPRSLHGPSERRKHGQQVAFPPSLQEEDVLAVTMGPGAILFNQLLTPHWVQSPEADLAFSVNLSHGGLRREARGRGLCLNEQELVDLCSRDAEAAALFDVKRGWKSANPPPVVPVS